MSGALDDDRYFEWLYRQLGLERNHAKTRSYIQLIRILYQSEFVWFIPNDDNRAEDGKELRYEWIRSCEDPDVDPDWLELGSSVLEMMIGVSRRLEFQADGQAKWWFWKLIQNLELQYYTDECFQNNRDAPAQVEHIINTLVWRTYSATGKGGLFPLHRARRNQTNLEIWYQLNAYVLERG